MESLSVYKVTLQHLSWCIQWDVNRGKNKRANSNLSIFTVDAIQTVKGTRVTLTTVCSTWYAFRQSSAVPSILFVTWCHICTSENAFRASAKPGTAVCKETTVCKYHYDTLLIIHACSHWFLLECSLWVFKQFLISKWVSFTFSVFRSSWNMNAYKRDVSLNS